MGFMSSVKGALGGGGGGGLGGLLGGGGGGVGGMNPMDLLNPMSGNNPMSPMFLPNFLQKIMQPQGGQPGGMFVNNVWGGGGQQPMSFMLRGQGMKSASPESAGYTPSYSSVGASWVDPNREQANSRMLPGAQVF